MTATERLRQLLDERGVKHLDFGVSGTYWQGASCIEYGMQESGRHLTLFAHDLTPEQAIAATLGRGECRDVCASVSEFTCSACGFNCDLTSWISLFDGDEGRHRHHHHGTPNYCPNCGREVVES